MRRALGLLYVANFGSGTLTPIATATNTAGPPIPTGSYPNPVAITPDGKTAYVGNLGSGTVTPIRIATSTAGPPIPTGASPDPIAITPDGKTAYVANQLSGTVTPIATATSTAGPPIPTGSGPVAIAITPATVTQAPAFTSGSADTVAFGRVFTFTVTTTGDPAPTITRTGRLPSGVRFADYSDGTATISGTPRKAAAGRVEAQVRAGGRVLEPVTGRLLRRRPGSPARCPGRSAGGARTRRSRAGSVPGARRRPR